jgi:hypothetical protein
MVHLIEQTFGAKKTCSDFGFHAITVAQKDVEGSEVMMMEIKISS